MKYSGHSVSSTYKIIVIISLFVLLTLGLFVSCKPEPEESNIRDVWHLENDGRHYFLIAVDISDNPNFLLCGTEKGTNIYGIKGEPAPLAVGDPETRDGTYIVSHTTTGFSLQDTETDGFQETAMTNAKGGCPCEFTTIGDFEVVSSFEFNGDLYTLRTKGRDD